MCRLVFLLLAGFIIFCSSFTYSFAEDFSRHDIEKIIIETLRKNPQILLDILRSNSELVLDIAQQGSNLKRRHTLEKQWREDVLVKKNVHTQNRPILGKTDAKVRIIAFSDFTCHFCQTSKPIIDKILNEFKDKVSFIFKSIPLDEHGIAEEASRWYLAIAEQNENVAWEFYNVLFSNRNELIADGEKFLRQTAKKLNVDLKKLEKSLKEDKNIRTILKEDRDDADALGIEGTPCFLINNIVVRGAQPLDLFRVAVQIALAEEEKK